MSSRRSLKGLAVFVTLAAVASLATDAGDCVPPPNEVCDNAAVFTNADLPYGVTAPLGCFNDVVDKPYFDVFYRFDCTRTGTYLIHMCGSSGDTYLRVYGDGCGWSDGFELAVADDECPGSPPSADPLLLIDLEAGQSYWLELGTWRPDPPWAPPLNSPYFFSVSFDDQPPGPAGSLDVEAGPGFQLQIAKDGRDLALSWRPSCILDDTDYAVYQGDLDVLGVHAPITCSTDGVSSYLADSPTGDAYFLITPHNGIVGGSYGTTSEGGQRPQGTPACLPRYTTECP
jgi:hypothetical protein